MADKSAVTRVSDLLRTLQDLPPETKVMLETNDGIFNVIAAEYEVDVLIIISEGY